MTNPVEMKNQFLKGYFPEGIDMDRKSLRSALELHPRAISDQLIDDQDNQFVPFDDFKQFLHKEYGLVGNRDPIQSRYCLALIAMFGSVDDMCIGNYSLEHKDLDDYESLGQIYNDFYHSDDIEAYRESITQYLQIYMDIDGIGYNVVIKKVDHFLEGHFDDLRNQYFVSEDTNSPKDLVGEFICEADEIISKKKVDKEYFVRISEKNPKIKLEDINISFYDLCKELHKIKKEEIAKSVKGLDSFSLSRLPVMSYDTYSPTTIFVEYPDFSMVESETLDTLKDKVTALVRNNDRLMARGPFAKHRGFIKDLQRNIENGLDQFIEKRL